MDNGKVPMVLLKTSFQDRQRSFKRIYDITISKCTGLGYAHIFSPM